MLRKILFICYIYSIQCFTQLNIISNIRHNRHPNKSIISMQDKLDNKLFNKIDKDKSGYIDKDELYDYYGKNDYMQNGDLDNNNLIDYAEFERLVNINKFGFANSGNLYVRNAIKFGLLNKNSILADGKASIFVGNKGFDPLNISTSIKTLRKYREAEIKHGRLAMLASVGWPISELYNPIISKYVHMPPLLNNNNKVPSILNGGLEKINPLFFMAIIVFTTTIESISLNKKYDEDKMPGDYGFDPLKFYIDKDPYTKRQLELKELNNGRLAMLAITYYSISEFIDNNAIINKTPYLFKSIL